MIIFWPPWAHCCNIAEGRRRESLRKSRPGEGGKSSSPFVSGCIGSEQPRTVHFHAHFHAGSQLVRKNYNFKQGNKLKLKRRYVFVHRNCGTDRRLLNCLLQRVLCFSSADRPTARPPSRELTGPQFGQFWGPGARMAAGAAS